MADDAVPVLGEPAVGLGTLGLQESAEAAVSAATDLGCALIDTGEHYGNLALVGAALKKSERKPFVIVKLSGMPSGEYSSVKQRMVDMLCLLGLERADLCLMHWPGLCTWDPTDKSPLATPLDFQSKVTSWDDFCREIGPAWTHMMQLQKDGLCAHVGTSNFYRHHLEALAETCNGAMPFANEIFIDMATPETAFVDYMQNKGIKVLAYRPVAFKPHADGVKALAERLGEGISAQSVILAWLLRRGIYPFVKCRGDHVVENLTIPAQLKDRIGPEDMEELKKCEVDARFSPEWFAKIWRSHNATATVSEEDVQMLTSMGIENAKARALLEKCGGDMDAAIDMAFS